MINCTVILFRQKYSVTERSGQSEDLPEGCQKEAKGECAHPSATPPPPVCDLYPLGLLSHWCYTSVLYNTTSKQLGKVGVCRILFGDFKGKEQNISSNICYMYMLFVIFICNIKHYAKTWPVFSSNLANFTNS